MGESSRRKALGIEAVPNPDQPIAPEKLKALYPELLELQLANANHQLEGKRIQAAQAALNAKVEKLAEGVSLQDWNIGLKTGKMVKLKGV